MIIIRMKTIGISNKKTILIPYPPSPGTHPGGTTPY